MKSSLSVSQLTKKFGDLTAVDSFDLELGPGDIFGLLGPNAAGKTTTIRMLSGIVRPTSGNARVLGLDLLTSLDNIKSRIGYVAQSFALYPELTVHENLTFYASLYGDCDGEAVEHLIDSYGLRRFSNRYAGQLSGGYKRRLSIACAVVHDPELVFLDEPTAGIDPVTRKELWSLFYDLAEGGKTLFVTTHYMEEAERCNKLAFLSSGRRVAYGSPGQIRDQLGSRQVYTFDSGHDPAMMAALQQLDRVLVVNRFGNNVRLVGDVGFDIEKLRSFLRDWPRASSKPVPVDPTLEDVFITLTKNAQ